MGIRRVEADLDEAVQLPITATDPLRQRADELGPVHGLHHVGVARDRGRLVALQPPDEVPAQRQVRALPGLGLGLLVAVLPHVGDPEVGQQTYVGGREVLRDHGQRDLGRVATPLLAGRGDPVADGCEVAGDLVLAPSGGGHGRTQTTPPSRPARAPSRR